MKILLYENIKKIAKTRGVSIYRIEKDLELSNGIIGKWNTSIPTAENILKVAKYLGVSMEELLQEEIQTA
ncbi:helix-turn-helix domain-containing protein [Enterococcus wangshanyuanii]|uniref:helix-turn-helix domain-containing protein n=1 Tax=Enterococcus wangshanyuanii TaxID=2005703 RepID=UPI0027E53B08|nr:helix-turn-helix domain-containing protein [Enterococcus wangshanyuanii]